MMHPAMNNDCVDFFQFKSIKLVCSYCVHYSVFKCLDFIMLKKKYLLVWIRCLYIFLQRAYFVALRLTGYEGIVSYVGACACALHNA